MAENRKLHIVMFPWLAFGHMIPFLELSKHIAKKGHRISFVSTPKNIDRLPKLPSDLSSAINLVKIPLPKIENLPENAEATTDLPHNKYKYLELAHDALKSPFSEFLQESSPDCVLFDFASYWVPQIASELKILTAYFSIFTASFIGFVGPVEVLTGRTDEKRTKAGDFTVPPKWVPFDTNVAFKHFEIIRNLYGLTGDEDNISFLFRIGLSIEGANFLAVRSCYEFEPEWLKLLENLHQKPVIPVGQLPTTPGNDSIEADHDSWRSMKEWLDNQEKGSVVYVAFGSEAKPSQTELNEIALGLELSGLPFFWVLRTKRGEADEEIIELPEGFEDRISRGGRGDRGWGFIVLDSWVPQLKILRHESVGGFLTHSGWNSVVEAIQYELTLILLIFIADQGLNARVLEAKKMGYCIPRDDRDGSFTRDSVADSLRLVMIEEEGKIYREKIKEMKGLFCDEVAQHRYVDNLLSYIQTSET